MFYRKPSYGPSHLKSNLDPLESSFHQSVRTLAQYLYVMRGCKEGTALNNWLEAEAQLQKYGDTESPDPATRSKRT
jgi:hypothetical protein